MAKIPLAPGTVEFQLRPGVAPLGPLGWRGVDSESDPGSLDPSSLQRADNFRIRGKNLVGRAGLRLIVDLGLGPDIGAGGTPNRVMWLGEAPTDNPRTRLWVSALGAGTCGPGIGSGIHHLDATEFPPFQSYSFTVSSTDYRAPMARYGGKLFMGDRTMLREVLTITAYPGMSTSQLTFSPPNSPIGIFPGYSVRCMIEFDSKLFVGLENLTTPAASKIVVWNGLCIQDDLTGIRPPIAMGLFQDKLVVGFDATAAHVRTRVAGAIPGTWTTVALAGYRTSTWGNAMQEYRQYLYIAGGAGDIFRYDGTALTLVHNVATADTADGLGVTSLALHRGLLYFGWNEDNAAAHSSHIGRLDPDSTAANEWVDNYKAISAEWFGISGLVFKQLTALMSYQEQVVFGGRGLRVGGTKFDDPKGVVEILHEDPPVLSGSEIFQFIQFP